MKLPQAEDASEEGKTTMDRGTDGQAPTHLRLISPDRGYEFATLSGLFADSEDSEDTHRDFLRFPGSASEEFRAVAPREASQGFLLIARDSWGQGVEPPYLIRTL